MNTTIACGSSVSPFRIQFTSETLLHYDDNRGRQSANHSLPPNMHLYALSLHYMTTCVTDDCLLKYMYEGDFKGDFW